MDQELINSKNAISQDRSGFQCSHCDLHMGNSSMQLFLKHCDECLHRRNYKIVNYYRREPTQVKVFCKLCKKTLDKTNHAALSEHRANCLGSLSNVTIDEPESSREEIIQLTTNSEPIVTMPSIALEQIENTKISKCVMPSEEDLIQLKYNLFQFTYMDKTDHLNVGMLKCLICNHNLPMDMMNQHREVCIIETKSNSRVDILITTSTQPIEENKFCFICNVSVSNETILTNGIIRNYVNSDEAHTTISNVPISDLIPEFLNGNESERDLKHESNKIICSQCFQNIDKYYEACITMQKLKDEISEQLLATESLFKKQNNPADEQNQNTSSTKNNEDNIVDHDIVDGLLNDYESSANDEVRNNVMKNNTSDIIQLDSSDDDEIDTHSDKHTYANKVPIEQLDTVVQSSDVGNNSEHDVSNISAKDMDGTVDSSKNSENNDSESDYELLEVFDYQEKEDEEEEDESSSREEEEEEEEKYPDSYDDSEVTDTEDELSGES